MTTYSCAVCGKPVQAVDGKEGVEFIRACDHEDAAILADVSATCYGEGSATNG